MDKLTITLIGALLLMGVVVICLSIGYLISGKSRLRRGTCGSLPSDKKKDKTKSCSICGATKVCEAEEKKPEEKKEEENT